MYATCLKTNYLKSPVGITPGKVILTWIPQDGMIQTAYQIQIHKDTQLVYDSGIVQSGRNEYQPDHRFASRSRYRWSITLWDENSVPGAVFEAYFETGIAAVDWKADWIDPEITQPAYSKRAIDGAPLNKASYLRKTFSAGDFENARLYITAHGVYDVYLNGAHIDGYFMAPGTSAYDHRIQVQTYDVGAYLRPGENEILVTVGEGWWRGSHGWSMFRYCYGTDLALLCQLELDGNTVLCTDGSWQATQDGPLQENDTMRLERYDARIIPENWHGVKVCRHGYDKLIGSSMPITAHERFCAKMITTPNGQQVLDFGQNIAGYVEIALTAQGGEQIRLQHSDGLGKDGNFQLHHFQNPDSPLCEQVIEYTCKPGKNLYHQTKCYYGFRYVLLETQLPVTGEEFTAVAVYSDMEQTGFFRCGNEDVNQLFRNTLWSMKSNFVDIPTDCPHREKLGFTGDAQVFAEAALYLMDCTPVYARWLREVAASQYENGCVPNVVPRSNFRQTPEPVGKDGSAGWCNAFEIVTTRIAERHNSTYLAKELYPNLRRWVQYNLEKAKEYRPENEDIPVIYRDYILDCANNWGEWNEPGRGPKEYFAELEATGHAEVATGFLAQCCLLVGQIAHWLGYKDDATYYWETAQKVIAAYRYAFTRDGMIESDRQCHYVRPVVHGLLTADESQIAIEKLANMIQAAGNHIGTGFLTTALLCDVLTDYGYAGTAYDLLLQTEQPSWLYAVKQGATTIWESWYGMRNGAPGGSQNHYSLGAVVGWLMSRACGIRLFNGSLLIRPYPDRRLGFAEATYHSPIGKIRSAWRYEGSSITFEVEIPANSTATLLLPDGTAQALCCGSHRFTCKAG